MRLPTAAYIHLPFCRRRCFYCDFPIQVVGDRAGAADAAAERYVNLLLREINASPSGIEDQPLRSIYFGGGTPSLTPPRLLSRIIQTVRSRYGLHRDFECTLEMDPGTFDRARLEAFLDAGVNRVSVGVQSFDDKLLKAAGRAHGLREVEVALDLLLGGGNYPGLSVSLDLISGLPHLTRESWLHSLDRAVESGAHHVSVYDLQVEPGTAFDRWYVAGSAPLPSDEDAAQMFRDASTRLRSAGFEHYEISSYAKPGRRCVHNRAYWNNAPFWGFGLGATSHVRGVRLARPRRMREYQEWVEGPLQRLGGFDEYSQSHGTAEPDDSLEALQTSLMLALRTDAGIDVPALRSSGVNGAAAASGCLEAAAELPPAWVECLKDSKGETRQIRLSDPEGLLFSNDAIATFLARVDERVEDECGASEK
mmetsp:Transcript_13517/g.26327  ORF Transcript_13517/g.26327 Transcript_13517/m.26327 type:complete len:422 (+) Transcript_13517:94-1359(+)